MPRVLQINSSANWGSTGRIAEQINATASSLGWETYFAYGRIANPSSSKLIHIGNKLSQMLALIGSRVFDNEGLFSVGVTYAFIHKIKKINPDVVHLHNIHGYYLNLKILFSHLNKMGVPIVWTLHDCWAFTGHCPHFDYIKCERWKKQCYSCPQKSDYPASWFIDGSKRNFRIKKKYFNLPSNLTLVPISQWLDKVVADSFLSSKKRVVINNGIDINKFHHCEPNHINTVGLIGKYVLLGVATTWLDKKGLSDYFLLSDMLDSQYQIVLIGLSEKQISSLPSKIIGIKRTSSIEELIEYYSIADVVMNLSYEESFGLTTVEGMACGTPGIVYDRTASPELITKQTGIVVTAGDLKSVTKAVEIICSKGKSFYQDACRKRAVEYYDKNIQYQKYIDLYSELMKKNGNRLFNA